MKRRTPSFSAPLSILLATCALTALAPSCGGTGEATSNSEGASTGLITGAGGASASSGATSSSGQTGGGGQGGQGHGAPYPVVLAHGFMGFGSLPGALSFETYFYGLEDHFAQKGEVVRATVVNPFSDSVTRAHELIPQIEAYLAETGAAKVNLIGHSQGGLDARVVAHERPDLVASVVTVATPHYGSPVADIVMKLVSDPNAQAILDAIIKILGEPLYGDLGQETSFIEAIKQFSTPGISAFNATITDSPGVYYASVTGRTALHGNDNACVPDVVFNFIKKWNDTLDPIDPLFLLFAGSLAGGQNYAHDGLVRVKDAKWGEFWGCVPADHTDEVGQLIGDGPGLGNGWDYVSFYDSIVGVLREKGY